MDGSRASRMWLEHLEDLPVEQMLCNLLKSYTVQQCNAASVAINTHLPLDRDQLTNHSSWFKGEQLISLRASQNRLH